MYGDNNMLQQQSRPLNQSIHQQQQNSYSNQQQQHQQHNYTNLPKPTQQMNTMGMTASSNSSTNMINANMGSSNMSNTSNLKNEWDQFFAQSVVAPNIDNRGSSSNIQSNQMYNSNVNNLPPVVQTNYNMKESLVKTIQESSGSSINNTNTAMFMKQGQATVTGGGGTYPNMSHQQQQQLQGNMSYNNSSGIYNNTSQQTATTRVNTAIGGGGTGNVLSAVMNQTNNQMLQSSSNNSNINMTNNNILPIAAMQGSSSSSTIDHRSIGERGFYNPNSSVNIGATGTGLNRSGGVMGGNILASDVRFQNRSINNNYQTNRGKISDITVISIIRCLINYIYIM